MTTGVLGMVVGGGQGSEAGEDRSCLPPPPRPAHRQEEILLSALCQTSCGARCWPS